MARTGKFTVLTTLVVVVAATASILFAQADDNTDGANKFIDQLLESLIKQKKIDPLDIPEHDAYFDKKIAGIHVKGDIKLTNTVIQGLSHIKRNGDVDLRSENGQFHVAMRLGDQQVMAASDIHIDLGKHIHKDLQAEIDIGFIDVQFALSIVDGKFKLDQFNVDELKHVEVKIHGLKALDPLVDIVADVFVAMFNKQTRELVTKVVKPIVEEEIEKFHF